MDRFHNTAIMGSELQDGEPIKQTRTGETDFIERVFVAAPGTEIMMDEDSPGATERRLHLLQHADVGDGHILLVPQPSLTNPNDPLRWPVAKKWVVLANGVFYAFNGAITGPMMAGGMKSCLLISET